MPLSPLDSSPRTSRRTDEKLRRKDAGSVTTEEMATPCATNTKSGVNARGYKLSLQYLEETILLSFSVSKLLFESFSDVLLSLVLHAVRLHVSYSLISPVNPLKCLITRLSDSCFM